MPRPADQARKHAQQVSERDRKARAEANDIGEIPPVENPERRAAAAASLKVFCETYFADRFADKWSPAHIEIIDGFERCIHTGDKQSVGIPRGFGKTTLAEAAALWAALNGLRRFVVLLGATEKFAEKLLNVIKGTLEDNELLAADYPEAIYPISRLERSTIRAVKQTYRGRFTRIKWVADRVVMPDVAGSPARGSVFATAGITGAVKGMHELGPDGEILRPDLVILDDIQTREAARSVTQSQERISLVKSDVLGLAGKKKLACFNLCTPIFARDSADRLLDPEEFPEFRPIRRPMLLSWPKQMELWDRYTELRAESYRNGGAGEEATEYYRDHRETMDAGAAALWPERHYEGELSAIQHAMNLYYANPTGFGAEYQMEPESREAAKAERELDPDAVAERINRVPRGSVPVGCDRVTAMVDVSSYCLWWAACAWDAKFGGSVVDYGAFPAQNRSYFAQSDARPNLASEYPGMGEEARLYRAVRDLLDILCGRRFPHHKGDAEPLQIELCLVDSRWKTDTVTKAIRESPFSTRVLPSQGFGVVQSSRPVSEWPVRPGERASPVGQPGWRLSVPERKKDRRVAFGADEWKSFVVSAWLAPVGSVGAMQIFGDKPSQHAMFADHMGAEFSKEGKARGANLEQWVQKPGRDNHLLDCYDAETDVLTRDGFKRFSELTEADELATVNLASDLIEYQQPTHLISKPHRGPMVQIGGGERQRVNLCVTPTHRMVVFAGQSGKGPVIKPAADLTIWDKIKTRATWAGDGRTTFTVPATRIEGAGRRGHPEMVVSAVDLAEFIGWYVAEGSRRIDVAPGKGRTYSVIISQISGPKQDAICRVLDRLPWRYHTNAVGAKMSNEQVYRLVCGLGNKYTMRVPQWVKEATPEVISAFLTAAVSGDGWRQRGHEAYATVSPRLADDMQELFLKAGYGVSVSLRKAKPYCIRGKSGSNTVDQFHIHRTTSGKASLRDSTNKPNFRTVEYDGLVYCATVPNGTLIVRRGGKVAVCGNCVTGAALAASVGGLQWSAATASGHAEPAKMHQPTMKCSEVLARKRAAAARGK